MSTYSNWLQPAL